MSKARCFKHPRRKVTHLVSFGPPYAADQLVCAECAQTLARPRPQGPRAPVCVQPITLVGLPTPVLVRGEPDGAPALVHISEEHIRAVGNVARCGTVLRTWAIVKETSHAANLCPACGSPRDFKTAAEAYAAWLKTLPPKCRAADNPNRPPETGG